MANGHVIVRYTKPSHWKSCNIIEEALCRKFSDAQSWIQEDHHQLPAGTKRLIIIDHRWLKRDKLIELSKSSDISIDFYLYGDFTLRLKDFSAHMDAFKNHEVGLIVASESQKRLVSQIFPEYKNLLKIIPYPVDEKRFSFNEEGRNAFRQRYNLGEGKVLGFSGRISRQKGVLELMTAFLKSDISGTLALLGPVESHSFWQFSDDGDKTFLSEFQRLLAVAGGKIIWIPEISYEEMPSFYSAIDTYVSMSYFHDEDFNLTLEEALAAGRPAIVTAWGGHWRCINNANVTFVGMNLSGAHVKPDSELLLMALKGASLKDSHERKKMGPLTTDERNFVRSNAHFLQNDDQSFNRELYYKIYSSYL